MNQIKLHKKIERIVDVGPGDVTKEQVASAMPPENFDAKDRFFEQADERWLDWLWKNDLLDYIKKPKEDKARRATMRAPELNYLNRMASVVPEKVAEIMLNTKNTATTKENFNPEAIDAFLRICQELPADELGKVVAKIVEENWVKAMGAFNSMQEYAYKEILKKLAEAEKYDALIKLASVVLTVKDPEDLEERERTFLYHPFYIREVSRTDVFAHLASVPGEHKKDALKVATKKLKEIIALESEERPKFFFEQAEPFSLLDTDLFELKVGAENRPGREDDVRELVATIVELLRVVIGKHCGREDGVRQVYEQYIKALPHTRTAWRLQLLALSLCPRVFQNELEERFNELFRVPSDKSYTEIIGGAEYYKALKRTFEHLSPDFQESYPDEVIDYFLEKHRNRKNDEENWHKVYAGRILSMIKDHPGIKEKAEENDIPMGDYKPSPTISRGMAGTVRDQSPMSQEDFEELSVSELAKNFKTIWTPKKLSEQNTSDDYLTPVNAEGAAAMMREDMKKRLDKYIENATLFFDPKELHPHYTYAFFRGIQEAVKDDRPKAEELPWGEFVKLCLNIKEEEDMREQDATQEKGRFDTWLGGWTAVHSGMAEAWRELLNESGRGEIVNFNKYRPDILGILDYLLHHPDPTVERESPKTAKEKMTRAGQNKSRVSDPFTMAINAVRGKAFQAFLMFIYKDGKGLKGDVKDVYEELLQREETRAIYFMLGHYLPTFYFRDRELINRLLPKIFSEDNERLYTAAWEGYLSTGIYEEMFFEDEFRVLYERAIDSQGLFPEDPEQQYFSNPKESLGTHLALAFIHYEDFGKEHSLFEKFWNEASIRAQAAFVSFIGRSPISGSNQKIEDAFRERPERFKEFWEWLLKQENIDREVYRNFGYWVSLEKGFFEPEWLAKQLKETLDEIRGSIEYVYGVEKALPEIAKADLRNALKSIEWLVLEDVVRGKNESRIPFRFEREWTDALETIYKNGNDELKKETRNLIDNLIKEGGRPFWGLKEIIKDEPKSNNN